MNHWTELSAEFAQQRNYLDELYKVYPITPNLRREIPRNKEQKIKNAFDNKNNVKLITELLNLELFPLKDSFVAFLKRDKNSINRNPETVNRLAGNLYHMGYDDMIEKCTAPKETNRQIGPMFKQWVDNGSLGAKIIRNPNEFLKCDQNCILNISDNLMKEFATNYLGFNRNKGIDFIAKFNNKYIFAETKFLTDFGGHQNAQFEDAINTMTSPLKNKKVHNTVIPIAILDGVLYIDGKNKMYKYLQSHENQIILSSLLLREFLYSI